MLLWHLLTREEDYAFARPAMTRNKVRRLELLATAATYVGIPLLMFIRLPDLCWGEGAV